MKKLNNSRTKYMRLAQLSYAGWAKFMDFCTAWGTGKLKGTGKLTIHSAGFLYHKEESVIMDRLWTVIEGIKTVSEMVSITHG